MRATLFSQVAIMQFQKQGIKYIYISVFSRNKRLLVANIVPYMFTYKTISNCCNLNYNIDLYLIHVT